MQTTTHNLFLYINYCNSLKEWCYHYLKDKKLKKHVSLSESFMTKLVALVVETEKK